MRFRDVTIEPGGPAVVMGILNVTPDSFYDGGKYRTVDRARARATEMVEQGARLIDVGGRSYRRGAQGIVSADEESARVLPVVAALMRDALAVPLSVDTVHASIAESALELGAHAINDCSGLADTAVADVVARYDAALFVMHIRGRPNIPQENLVYADALREISDILRERVDAAIAAGVARDSIIVDPGLEFGKGLSTDLEIVARFGELRALGFPVLLAASRKSFMTALLDRQPDELLAASLAVAALGVSAGAAIVRAHDVAETVDVVELVAAVESAKRITSA